MGVGIDRQVDTQASKIGTDRLTNAETDEGIDRLIVYRDLVRCKIVLPARTKCIKYIDKDQKGQKMEVRKNRQIDTLTSKIGINRRRDEETDER